MYSGDDSGETTDTQNAIIDQLKEAIKIDFKRKMVVYVLYDLMNQVSGPSDGAQLHLLMCWVIKELVYSKFGKALPS